jgi:hypothetical protein
MPPGAKETFYQPFTLDEWAASNFAPKPTVEWFKDVRYDIFIHFHYHPIGREFGLQNARVY